jgi:hypothetical protein
MQANVLGEDPEVPTTPHHPKKESRSDRFHLRVKRKIMWNCPKSPMKVRVSLKKKRKLLRSVEDPQMLQDFKILS